MYKNKCEYRLHTTHCYNMYFLQFIIVISYGILYEINCIHKVIRNKQKKIFIYRKWIRLN